MFCRNCGKEVNERAFACPTCGVPPFLERKFCSSCGVETQAAQVLCVKCGTSLAGISGGKSKIAAGLLGILLGNFGVHKFYLGYTSEGVITLVLFFVCIPLIYACGVGMMGLMVLKVITLIEGIIYLTKSDEEFERIYVRGRQGWF